VSVVCTGFGVVSPLGCDVASFADRMFAGASAVSATRGTLAADDFPVPHVGRVDLEERDAGEFAARATAEALSELPGELPIDGLVYGTVGGFSFELAAAALAGGAEPGETRPELPTRRVVETLVARGHESPATRDVITVNAACASGAQAIAMGAERIRSGRWRRALVGAVDARAEPGQLMRMHLLSALTTAEVPSARASRPFSADRSGFVWAEGAASFLLESAAAARERGAAVHGEVAGWALSNDAWRLTDGREDQAAIRRVMRDAVASAGIEPEQIDYVNAHGTSTRLNDRLESAALEAVFGDHAREIPVSSLKSQMGHAAVAAGAIEAAACLLMLREQRVAPTLNLEVPDPDCALDFVPGESRPAPIDYLLSNSFGFGGQNASLVLKRTVA
jgi:3-oxoacyl-[acyl-carrier-protein] synthase II